MFYFIDFNIVYFFFFTDTWTILL